MSSPSNTWMDARVASQQASRLLGYTGAFGGGDNVKFVASLDPAKRAQYDEYTKNLNQYGMQWKPTQTVSQLQLGNITNPQLPNGTSLVPQLQEIQSNEIQGGTEMAAQAPVVASQVAPAPTIVAAQTAPTAVIPVAQAAPAPVVDASNPAYQVDASAGQYDPALLGQAAQSENQTMQLSDKALVQNQLATLTDFADGAIPMWAKGIVNRAEGVLARRGLGSSSIAGGAIAGALSEAALPIAMQDATTYFQTDLTNFNARQQTSLENAKLRQQQMLSDQAATNAGLQFNASSATQVQEFMANLAATIDTTNADRISALSQFNAAQANIVGIQNAANENDMSKFNVGQENAVRAANATNEIEINKYNAQLKDTAAQFNANMNFNRDQFNSTMRYAIDQSNVNWRRAVNTANTAGINAANQTNVQNQFNLSQIALNNVWQQYRDEATWLNESAMNVQNQQFQLAMLANQQNFALSQASFNKDLNTPSLAELAGSFAMNLFS